MYLAHALVIRYRKAITFDRDPNGAKSTEQKSSWAAATKMEENPVCWVETPQNPICHVRPFFCSGEARPAGPLLRSCRQPRTQARPRVTVLYLYLYRFFL